MKKRSEDEVKEEAAHHSMLDECTLWTNTTFISALLALMWDKSHRSLQTTFIFEYLYRSFSLTTHIFSCWLLNELVGWIGGDLPLYPMLITYICLQFAWWLFCTRKFHVISLDSNHNYCTHFVYSASGWGNLEQSGKCHINIWINAIALGVVFYIHGPSYECKKPHHYW